MVVKIDFFVSPAYCVPPMMISLRAKLRMTKVPLRVPSRLGSASKRAALMTVNSGAKFGSGWSGTRKRWRAKRLCQASSVTTRTGSR